MMTGLTDLTDLTDPAVGERQRAAFYGMIGRASGTLAPDRARPPILELAAIAAGDQARVGNKAWRLAWLARAGLPVPPGFCIAADAFAADSSDSAEADTEEFDPLDDAITAAYRRLGSPLVAVRSSAADEDLDEQSGAGVYTTILNVHGDAALLAAVRRCRASRPPTAHDQTPPALAVLVQTQVDAEAAGVLFTADPMSGTTDRRVINVVHGLGEPLAAGRVNGDTFHVSPTGELLAQQIRRKETMLTRHGIEPVPPGRRQRPTLTGPELRRLAGLATQVERHFNAPATGLSGALPSDIGTGTSIGIDMGIDIEFAFVRGRPILLQARPIPARLIKDGQRPSDAAALQEYVTSELQKISANATFLRRSGRVTGSDIVWSAGNIRELLPTPSRFSFALFSQIFAGRRGAIAEGRRRLGYRLGPQAGDELFALIAGQPYFNLEIDAATYDVGVALPIERLLAAVEARPECANYPELGLYPDTLATTPGGLAAGRDFRQRMLDQASRQRRRFAALLRWLDQRRATPVNTATAPTTAATADELQAAIAVQLRQLRQLGIRFVIAARFGFCFADLARRHLLALSPNQAAGQRRYARLLQGLPGSAITEQTHDLERLAKGQLDAAGFLTRHGHLARNELELSLPRLLDHPEQVDAMLAELRAGGRSPQAEFARQKTQRLRCERALRRSLAARPEELSELLAELDAAQHYLPLRETLKYHLAIHYAQLRTLLLALAKNLGWPTDSLFQLEPTEVVALPTDTAGRATWLALSEQRRQERTLARRLTQQRPPPTVIFASRPELAGRRPGRDAKPEDNGHDDRRSELKAEAIAPGHAEGIVRIIRLDDEATTAGRPRLNAGSAHEILVAPSANLGLAPLFRSVAGVIVEVGGVLAHCACQAREAGIPALVLGNATRLLRDGDRVRLDAEHGRVVLLARADGPPREWQ